MYFFLSAVINAVVVSVQAKRVAASHRGLRVRRVEGLNLIFAVASIMVFAFSLQRTPDPLATALGEAAPESALAPRPALSWALAEIPRGALQAFPWATLPFGLALPVHERCEIFHLDL